MATETENNAKKHRDESFDVERYLSDGEWAIALSGGGIRGMAHLGVLQAFEEAGYKPSAISGCSSGALVGALYAAGKSPREILERIKVLRWWRELRLGWFYRGFVDTISFVNPFLNWLPKTFEELELPLYVNAMDLAKGEDVVFKKGALLPAIQASMALPIICRPVEIKKKVLYDGGLLNNLPIEPLRNKYDTIVAVHTNAIDHKKIRLHALPQIMERVFQLVISQNVRKQKKRSSLWIEPKEVGHYRVFDFKKAEEIFDIGYKHTQNILAKEQVMASKETL